MSEAISKLSAQRQSCC